ncbi:type III effector [Pseudomonas sp. CCM 7891]|uniref:Type III effector n=2 Tax=Pseudomonas karstica TaxID=1055468 RepID=A0A7X2RVH0_9PSED|nr:type III effector [Pseudomonas karstica]
MRQEDIAPYANARFTPNYGAPTYEVAQQASGEIHGGWSVKNNAINNKKFPFISLKRNPPVEEEKSVGDKFHISVNPKDMPKAFEIISRLINAEESPLNSWKATDTSRVDPRDTRISLGAQFTLYPKPDRADGTYSPEYMGKTQALITTIEQELQAAGIGQSDNKPASDVSAPQWHYASYRNEFRSDREGSPSQSASLKEEPFFKLMSSAQ